MISWIMVIEQYLWNHVCLCGHHAAIFMEPCVFIWTSCHIQVDLGRKCEDHFFHTIVIMRRKTNRIHNLSSEKGIMYGEATIYDYIFKHFKVLFGHSKGLRCSWVPKLQTPIYTIWRRIYLTKRLKCTFKIGSDKSLGLEGFLWFFYRLFQKEIIREVSAS